MPLDTFVPPRKVAAGGSIDTSPRINAAMFGDGYSQRSQDGLNDDNETFSGQCMSLTKPQVDDLIAFFKAHKVTPFLWVPPLEDVSVKWTATKWSRAYAGSGLRHVSFTFTKVFDL
jgi:phage-related protein